MNRFSGGKKRRRLLASPSPQTSPGARVGLHRCPVLPPSKAFTIIPPALSSRQVLDSVFFKIVKDMGYTAFYIASTTLSNIYWAAPFGRSDLDFMIKLNGDILSWYEDMRNPVPSWYIKGEIL
jgi:hypothetical protein